MCDCLIVFDQRKRHPFAERSGATQPPHRLLLRLDEVRPKVCPRCYSLFSTAFVFPRQILTVKTNIWVIILYSNKIKTIKKIIDNFMKFKSWSFVMLCFQMFFRRFPNCLFFIIRFKLFKIAVVYYSNQKSLINFSEENDFGFLFRY